MQLLTMGMLLDSSWLQYILRHWNGLACFAATCQGWERKYELETSDNNQSGFTGVFVHRAGKKRFNAEGVLGTFATAHEAALAHAKARTAARQQQAQHEVRSSREATRVP